MSSKPELNKIEAWIAEHSIRVLLVIAVVILVGGYFIARAVDEAAETSQKVTRIEPQVTRVNKAICDKQSLEHAERAERCAERIRVGLLNCKRVERCRAAFLAVLTYPPRAHATAPSSATAPGGGDAFQPSTGHQQPSPGEQPGHEDREASSAPLPSPPPAPGAPPGPEAPPPPETPGNGAQGGSTSGAGVEVCALERCVGAEVGLGN